MESSKIRKHNTMLREITRVSDMIRRKHNMIKLEKDTGERAISEMFKPLVTPLHELVDTSKQQQQQQQQQIKQEAKMEPASMKPENIPDEDEYDDDNDDDDDNVEDAQDHNHGDNGDSDRENDTGDDGHENDTDGDDTLVAASTSTPLKKKVNAPTRYLNMFNSEEERKKLDTTYGVRRLAQGLMIGDSYINFSDNLLYIGNKTYENTPGLLELLFKKSPDPSVVNEGDKKTYIKILKRTNAERKYYRSDGPLRDDKKSVKYRDFIAPYVRQPRNRIEKSGEGLPNYRPRNRIEKFVKGLPKYKIARQEGRQVEYVHWDDPNELVDRLRLVIASRAAGHTGHSNEILSIMQELREAGVIY
jgi:hypothetical protein